MTKIKKLYAFFHIYVKVNPHLDVFEI